MFTINIPVVQRTKMYSNIIMRNGSVKCDTLLSGNCDIWSLNKVSYFLILDIDLAIECLVLALLIYIDLHGL